MNLTLRNDKNTEVLEARVRASKQLDWRPLTEGQWGEGTYHSGYIEYWVACLQSSEWVLKSVERAACLDDIKQEDIDQGMFLDDDQLQALHNHGNDLDAAKSNKYEEVAVLMSATAGQMDWEIAGNLMYKAHIASGGKEVILFDEKEGDYW